MIITVTFMVTKIIPSSYYLNLVDMQTIDFPVVRITGNIFKRCEKS